MASERNHGLPVLPQINDGHRLPAQVEDLDPLQRPRETLRRRRGGLRGTPCVSPRRYYARGLHSLIEAKSVREGGGRLPMAPGLAAAAAGRRWRIRR